MPSAYKNSDFVLEYTRAHYKLNISVCTYEPLLQLTGVTLKQGADDDWNVPLTKDNVFIAKIVIKQAFLGSARILKK